MRTNHLRARLAANDVCRGVWLSLPSVASARLLARLPCDWLLVDTEHAPMDVSTMSTIVAAIADANGPAPLVRVAQATVENIKRALDAGAWGILAPMINTRAEAELVVQAAKYPPQGSRSSGSAWAALAFDTDNATYFHAANAQTMAMVQIESRTAVENLEPILSVPGVDMAFVGSVDLSISLGLEPHPEQQHPRFREAIDHILHTARGYRVPVGIFCSNSRAAADRIEQGFQFVNVATDLGALLNGVRSELAASRSE